VEKLRLFEAFKFVKIALLISMFTAGCGEQPTFDQLEAQSSGIPSGSIIVTSNANGAAGPGLISVWTPSGELDRVIYDYTKVTTGYASGLAYIAPNMLLAVTDTGGSASNDFLDFFDYDTPFANPVNLFSSLVSGGAGTYMRQMAMTVDATTGRRLAFVSESGSNRIARLSSPNGTKATDFNFTRDYNFSANGTCTLTTPYGVALIPTTGYIAVVHSAAAGRVNIFAQDGTCIGSTAMANFPTGAAYHAKSGKILVTYQTTHAIYAHNATTGAASPATAIYTSAGQLSTPKAIATDANGYIYVSSDGLDQVVKLYWDGVSATATYVGTAVGSSVFTQNITSITVVP
jgi:hypothetical protein